MADDNHWKTRANDAADAFRVLCAAVASAIVLFSVNVLPKVCCVVGEYRQDADPALLYVSWARAAGLFALFLLGLSWVIQKAKALARRDMADDGPTPPTILTNEVYDVLAFASLMYGMTLLVLVGAKCSDPLVPALVAPFFFLVAVVVLEWRVCAWRRKVAPKPSKLPTVDSSSPVS